MPNPLHLLQASSHELAKVPAWVDAELKADLKSLLEDCGFKASLGLRLDRKLG